MSVSQFLLRDRSAPRRTIRGQKLLIPGQKRRGRGRGRGAIRERRQLFPSSISHSPGWFFLSGRVSHADLTAVVLDTAARTAFPATRPGAHRALAGAAAGDSDAAREGGWEGGRDRERPLYFLLFAPLWMMTRASRQPGLRPFVRPRSRKPRGLSSTGRPVPPPRQKAAPAFVRFRPEAD